jgi:hypothetical protein
MVGNTPFVWGGSDVNMGYRGRCIKISQGVLPTVMAWAARVLWGGRETVSKSRAVFR